jgi:predicted nucleic acid-binding protein
MKDKLLFDTSIWIDFFNGTDNEKVSLLTEYITNDYPIYICPVIIQEILQGIKSDKQYIEVKEAILALIIINEDPVMAAIGAADLYRKLRKTGLTIRKGNDCLIAWYGIKNSLKIIHRDRDFDIILKG